VPFTHTANPRYGPIGLRLFRLELLLNFDFFFSDAMSFASMNFCFPNFTIGCLLLGLDLIYD
ncbi:MAG TPA: hypothetical protein VK210_03585, partial [Terriglobia bacterium]|nr:hypothetical protein [Terriglobia bacterium]